MTIKELKEELEKYPEDTRIRVRDEEGNLTIDIIIDYYLDAHRSNLYFLDIEG